MRMLVVLGLLCGSVLCPSVGFAQDRFSPADWLDGLPPLASDAAAVYDQFFPKGKKNVYEKYALMLQAEILPLYKESGRKSRLLSMYAGTYENVDKWVDVSKISLSVDKGLEEKFRECMRLFISAQDEYARADGRGLDSLNKQVYANDFGPSIGKVEEYLAVEKRCFPPLVEKTGRMVGVLNTYMEARGFNKILDGHQTQNPYYIQLLECRAGIFDTIKRVNEMARSIGFNLALMMEGVRKSGK